MHSWGDPQDAEDRRAGTSSNRDAHDIIMERRCIELDRCLEEQARAAAVADFKAPHGSSRWGAALAVEDWLLEECGLRRKP